MKPQLRAIFWDLDGTLINSEVIHEQAALDALKEIGFTYEQSIPAGLENSAVFELLTKLKITDNLQLFKKWNARAIDLALSAINDQHAIPQSIQLMKCFAKLGIPQSVVSNSPQKMVEHSLEQIGIHSLCNKFFSRDSVEFGKPHPQLYLNAIEYNQQRAESCLCFEDSGTGIKAAKAAQINCIGVGIDSYKYNPNLVCDLAKESWLDEVLLFIDNNYSQ